MASGSGVASEVLAFDRGLHHSKFLVQYSIFVFHVITQESQFRISNKECRIPRALRGSSIVSQTLPLQVGMEPYPGCKLRQPLGKGGFAEVWEGEEAKGRLLALKFIPSREDMSTSREIQAIQAVRKLKHPGLIEIENVMMNWSYIIVALEVAGGRLTELLEA